MSRVSDWLNRRVWKLRVGIWLMVFFGLAAGALLVGIFFVRRDVVQYWPATRFSVADPAFFGSAHALADPLPIDGNQIELLQNGDGIFPPMLEAIRAANKTVNFEAFLMYSGSVASEFQKAFIEKAQSGVRVRVLLDGIGSGTKLKDAEVEQMKKAGVQFAYYHPTRSWRLDRMNRRSHRRILVVDGKVGFTGSVGFADEWSGSGNAPGHWHDIQLRIQGPIVAKLQGAFQQHWIESTGELISGPDEFPALERAGNSPAQVTASHAFSVAPLPLIQAVAIACAEKRISITNAYCTPSHYQVELLGQAVKRGVDVRLILPGQHNDQPATKAAGRTAYGELLERGVKIFEFEPTMIHTKAMVVDGQFAVLGSSNLDARSNEINEELDISVYDRAFGAEMEKLFEQDLAKSKPYTLEQFRQRSWKERAMEWLSMPLRSQM